MLSRKTGPIFWAFNSPIAALCLLALAPLVAAADDTYSEEERQHWSLVPRSQPEIPAAADSRLADWPAGPADAFVLQRLTASQLSPAPQATRLALIRRVTFALNGLPPTPDEISHFANDSRPDAYERLVDRLLASPSYGEAFGQHWLDVVRYAESEGFEYDRHRAGAWRYRDYVVRSFNSDKPFDRLILEQVAGDELPAAEHDEKIAVGFHRLGPVRRNAGNTDVAFSRNEVLTEMTDAIGSSFLGLTVGCARCHDHMFDAIRQRDYYRLQAFLAATHERDVQLGDPADIQRWNAENDAIQAEIKTLSEAINQADGEELETLKSKLKIVKKRTPATLETISSVANDASRRTDVHLLERGQTDKPRELVGPRALGVLLTGSIAEHPNDIAMPKSLLAEWLIDPAHPLTARVYANRIWNYQFGQGIVATPNDFGVNGGAPSHPALLDYLANELVRAGWSTKHLHRLIVTSSAYKQASEIQNPISNIQNPQSLDPDNRLLWHFARRRLTAEQLRDSLLVVSGRVNRAIGGPSIMPPVKSELVQLLYEPEQWQVTPDPREHDRRSIYLVAKRNLRLPFMEVFDQPDLLISCARRISSTHAPQSLELLNGEFANDLAKAFAERLRSEAGNDRQKQIERAFWLAAGRPPTAEEIKLANAFLDEQPLSEFALAMFNLNVFLYVE